MTKAQPSRAPDRQEVLSILLAQQATKNRAVVEFRNDVLKNRLLAPEEVKAWIQQRSEVDGPATVWLNVPMALLLVVTDVLC